LADRRDLLDWQKIWIGWQKRSARLAGNMNRLAGELFYTDRLAGNMERLAEEIC
jgi:hypothetical protein